MWNRLLLARTRPLILFVVVCVAIGGCDAPDDDDLALPTTKLELTITPTDYYAYYTEEMDYDVKCSNDSLLPAEYVCFVRVLDQDGNAKEVFRRTQKTLESGSVLVAAVELQNQPAGEYTIDAALFSSAALALQTDLDNVSFEEIGNLVEPTAQASTPLHVRQVELDLIFTPDESGLGGLFEVKWDDATYLGWLTERNALADFSYTWTFSDVADAQQVPLDSGNETTHEFSSAGDYTVGVGLWQDADKLAFVEEAFQIGSEPRLSVVAPEGELFTATDYTFEAQYAGQLPEDPYYEWDFGDQKDAVGVPLTPEAVHSFEDAGSFTVGVSLFAGEGGTLVDTASVDVVVTQQAADQTERLWKAIRAANFRASIGADHRFTNTDGTDLDSKLCACTWDGGGGAVSCEVFYCRADNEQITWNGNSFSVTIDQHEENEPVDGVTRTRTVRINGELSPDASTLVSLTVSETIDDKYVDSSVRMDYGQGFEVHNVELSNLSFLSLYLVSDEEDPELPNDYEVAGCLYGAEASQHAEGMELDCVWPAEWPYTAYDYTYAYSLWPDSHATCIVFSK